MASRGNRYDTKRSFHEGCAHLCIIKTLLGLQKLLITQQVPPIWSEITVGSFPAACCVMAVCQRPSFPNASIGNPDGTGTGPPIKTFGGDAFGANAHKCFRYLAACRKEVHYSITVTGNWRLTFMVEGNGVTGVHFEDYH